MSSSFFIKKKVNPKFSKESSSTATKRKIDGGPGSNMKGHAKKRTSKFNEEISSDSEPDSPTTHRKRTSVEEDDNDETPQEKKLRLAKLYLEQLRDDEENKAEEESFETDLIAGRLQDEVLEQKGKLQRLIAKDLLPPDSSEIRFFRGHKLPVTCLVITPDDKCIFSAAKDCSIIKWDVATGKKLHTIAGGRKGTEDRHVGHTAHVLCMSISSDGKYLATGDMNKLIMIWEAETCKHLYKFTGHRGPVSGLSFRRGTHDLYSASHDRSIKVWNVDENAYVETLFGHQDRIMGLDSLSRERCVSVGGRDGSVRVWKIAEESQLVFRGHEGSIDCVQLINEEHMITGADDGSVCLWSVNKKKPMSTVKRAHGCHGDAGLEQPHWVSSVAALQNSDTVASGSHDSKIQLWKCGQGYRGLQRLFTVPVTGFINSMKFSSAGQFLVAGVGQEHRLGRWWRLKEAKNGLYIIPLKRRTPQQEESTPQEEESTPQEEESTPQEEESTPQEEESTPQEEESTPQEEESTPQEEESTPQEEESTPQEEESTPQQEESTPQEEESTPQEEESTPQQEESTLQEEESTPQQEESTLQEEEADTGE